MLKKEFTALIIAIVCGFLAFMIYVKKSPKSGTVITEGARCVVAAGFLDRNTVLSKEAILFSAPMKPGTDVSDYFLQKEDLIGKQLIEPVQNNAPILRSNVRMPATGEVKKYPDSMPIPPGTQAVVVSANEADGLTDQMVPGSYADLMGSAVNVEGKTELTTLAYSVPIIAVNKGRDETIKGVTLALLPEEAENVFSAMSRGRIRINLLAGKKDKPSYLPKQGIVEVFKGVDRRPDVIFAGGSKEPPSDDGTSVRQTAMSWAQQAANAVTQSGMLPGSSGNEPSGAEEGTSSYE